MCRSRMTKEECVSAPRVDVRDRDEAVGLSDVGHPPDRCGERDSQGTPTIPSPVTAAARARTKFADPRLAVRSQGE